MTIDTIKHLGAEFHRAADSLADTLARLDNARLERLTFLRRCSKDSTARLAAIKEELRTLPEQIAKWDAEAARLESQTAEDLLRQALEPVQEEKPEPYRAGLPPERLRKVWAEWKEKHSGVYVFRKSSYRSSAWLADWADSKIGTENNWRNHLFRPHGATWARVEAMADEAEKKPPPALLDLTKLPPGTVCEAVGDIRTYLGRCIQPGEVFRIVEPDDELGDRHPTKIEIDGGFYSVPALVPARVVKEGGEDAHE